MPLKNSYSPLILFVLLTTMLFVQTHVKIKPVTFIAIFTLVTFLAFVFKKDKLSAILLIILLTFAGFCFWFVMCYLIKGALRSPVSREHPVMDMSWIFYIPISAILAVLTSFLYFKKLKRHRAFEQYGLLVYFLATILIIFIF